MPTLDSVTSTSVCIRLKFACSHFTDICKISFGRRQNTSPKLPD